MVRLPTTVHGYRRRIQRELHRAFGAHITFECSIDHGAGKPRLFVRWFDGPCSAAVSHVLSTWIPGRHMDHAIWPDTQSPIQLIALERTYTYALIAAMTNLVVGRYQLQSPELYQMNGLAIRGSDRQQKIGGIPLWSVIDWVMRGVPADQVPGYETLRWIYAQDKKEHL